MQLGTIIVDDSGSHCFSLTAAVARLENQADLLITERGVLRAPQALPKPIYFPQSLSASVSRVEDIIAWGRSSANITGCIFASLLCDWEDIQPTVGDFAPQVAITYHQRLKSLGFQAAQPHCEGYALPTSAIARFREKYAD